jgi:hypothetical protein
VIDRARIRVLNQLPALDNASREMIRTNAPKIRFSGVPFGGDYFFEWTISSNRTAGLDAFNTFDHLESAPVTIRQPAHDSHYWLWKDEKRYLTNRSSQRGMMRSTQES